MKKFILITLLLTTFVVFGQDRTIRRGGGGGGGGSIADFNAQFGTDAAGKYILTNGANVTNLVIGSGTLTIPLSASSPTIVAAGLPSTGIKISGSSAFSFSNSTGYEMLKVSPSFYDFGEAGTTAEQYLRFYTKTNTSFTSRYYNNNTVRWWTGPTNDGSGGFKLVWGAFDGSGVLIDNPLTIPQTGAATLARTLNLDGSLELLNTAEIRASDSANTTYSISGDTHTWVAAAGDSMVYDSSGLTIFTDDLTLDSGNLEISAGTISANGFTDTAATGNFAAYFDAGGAIVESSTTDTELGYVNGVTSAIQTQLDGKSAKSDSETFVLMEPDAARGVSDDLVLKKFIAEKYPSGVTITSIHIDASAAYTSETFLFEHWDDASGTTQATVESIACSAISTEDDGTLSDATIPADYFLVLNFDDTPEDVAYVTITISFTY